MLLLISNTKWTTLAKTFHFSWFSYYLVDKVIKGFKFPYILFLDLQNWCLALYVNQFKIDYLLNNLMKYFRIYKSSIQNSFVCYYFRGKPVNDL